MDHTVWTSFPGGEDPAPRPFALNDVPKVPLRPWLRQGAVPGAPGRVPRPDSVLGQDSGFGRVDAMTESEPAQAKPGAQGPPGDALAARLLAAQRALSALNVDPETRLRLHLRYMAICTSLKMPGADKARGASRLDRLMADAEQARGVNPGKSG